MSYAMAVNEGDVKEQELHRESTTQEGAVESQGRFGDAAHEHDDQQRDGQAARSTPGADGAARKGSEIDEQA